MHLRVVLLLAALALAACRRPAPAPPASDPDSRRSLTTGEIVGFTGAYGSHVWRGIPYAKPPVGELRWRAPQPPAPWTGLRDARKPPPVCPQFPSRFAGIEAGDPDTPIGQEDCLYLNVHAPRLAPAEVPNEGSRLPVMVWIHGGGNVIGYGSFYDGGNLAATHDVVVVTLNYRLGPLGWLRHAALRDAGGSDDDLSGNFGTLDLVRGLEWVRDNIAAFGGDPGNVTIFGESAGGRNVFSLLLSPRARNLFHRAIVQSGSSHTAPVEEGENFADAAPRGHRNSSNEVLLRMLRADGKARSRAQAKERLVAMKLREVETTLRGKKPRDLLAAYRTEAVEGLIEVPQVFRDGAVLPAADPAEALRAGTYNRVPTIFGTNRDENKLFLAVNREYVRWLFGILPIVRDAARYDATARHLSRQWKVRGADRPASLMRTVQGPSVWVYRFDWDEEPKLLFIRASQLLGAAHGFEIPFVFGHWNLGSQTSLFFDDDNAPGRTELSRKMMSYWAEFARAGDPGAGRDGSLPRWEPFEASRGSFLVFDTEADGGVRMERGLVTIGDVIAAVDRDPDLPTLEAKCQVYRRLVEWGREPDPDEYPRLGSKGCDDFPLPEPKVE